VISSPPPPPNMTYFQQPKITYSNRDFRTKYHLFSTTTAATKYDSNSTAISTANISYISTPNFAYFSKYDFAAATK
jgi:hypothetical protein